MRTSKILLGAVMLVTAGACEVVDDDDTKTESVRTASVDAAVEDGDDAGSRCTVDLCQTATAVPADQSFVAPDLCVRAVALRQGALRQLATAPNGDLFGVTQDGEIRRYRDANCDGHFDATPPEQVAWANTGGNGTSLFVDAKDRYLYAGTPQGVARWRYAEGADSGGDRQDVVLGQPTTGRHYYTTVRIYDGWLYMQSGSADNVVFTASGDYDRDRSLIKRFRLSDFDAAHPFEWQHGEVFAVGLRNTVGFARDPNAHLYGVVNGIDDLYYNKRDVHESNPGELVVRLEQDAAYGFPFCFAVLDLKDDAGTRFAPGTQLHVEVGPAEQFMNPHDDAWCKSNAAEPHSLLDPHSAPLDIAFIDPKLTVLALPERWRQGAFVALHGSWNRTNSTGFKVVWLPWNAQGRPDLPAVDDQGVRYTYEVVFGGGSTGVAKDGKWGWQAGADGEDVVRPVGVVVSPADGALYVSSDNHPIAMSGDMSTADGAIYRIALRR